MEEFYEIKGLNVEQLKAAAARIRASGRQPFLHYTGRAGTILQGPLIDEIMGQLYPTFDSQWHVAFIVPERLKSEIEKQLDGYGE